MLDMRNEINDVLQLAKLISLQEIKRDQYQSSLHRIFDKI